VACWCCCGGVLGWIVEVGCGRIDSGGGAVGYFILQLFITTSKLFPLNVIPNELLDHKNAMTNHQWLLNSLGQQKLVHLYAIVLRGQPDNLYYPQFKTTAAFAITQLIQVIKQSPMIKNYVLKPVPGPFYANEIFLPERERHTAPPPLSILPQPTSTIHPSTPPQQHQQATPQSDPQHNEQTLQQKLIEAITTLTQYLHTESPQQPDDINENEPFNSATENEFQKDYLNQMNKNNPIAALYLKAIELRAKIEIEKGTAENITTQMRTIADTEFQATETILSSNCDDNYRRYYDYLITHPNRPKNIEKTDDNALKFKIAQQQINEYLKQLQGMDQKLKELKETPTTESTKIANLLAEIIHWLALHPLFLDGSEIFLEMIMYSLLKYKNIPIKPSATKEGKIAALEIEAHIFDLPTYKTRFNEYLEIGTWPELENNLISLTEIQSKVSQLYTEIEIEQIEQILKKLTTKEITPRHYEYGTQDLSKYGWSDDMTAKPSQTEGEWGVTQMIITDKGITNIRLKWNVHNPQTLVIARAYKEKQKYTELMIAAMIKKLQETASKFSIDNITQIRCENTDNSQALVAMALEDKDLLQKSQLGTLIHNLVNHALPHKKIKDITWKTEASQGSTTTHLTFTLENTQSTKDEPAPVPTNTDTYLTTWHQNIDTPHKNFMEKHREQPELETLKAVEDQETTGRTLLETAATQYHDFLEFLSTLQTEESSTQLPTKLLYGQVLRLPSSQSAPTQKLATWLTELKPQHPILAALFKTTLQTQLEKITFKLDQTIDTPAEREGDTIKLNPELLLEALTTTEIDFIKDILFHEIILHPIATELDKEFLTELAIKVSNNQIQLPEIFKDIKQQITKDSTNLQNTRELITQIWQATIRQTHQLTQEVTNPANPTTNTKALPNLI